MSSQVLRACLTLAILLGVPAAISAQAPEPPGRPGAPEEIRPAAGPAEGASAGDASAASPSARGTAEVTVSARGTTDESPSLTVPSLETARAEADRVVGGTDVIDAEEFLRGRSTTLPDVLAFSPGVFVQSRFGAEEARISIRGSGLQRTFHGRGLRLLFDGVPINLADGGFDMQAIEPQAARYVEVFRGAGNALEYGSTTLGGAVHFVSRTGHDASRLQVRGEYGSFSYARGQVSSGMELGDFDYYLSLSHGSQDSFRDHARQSNQRLFTNVGWRLGDDVETRFYFTTLTTDSELPGSLLKSELENDPQDADTTPAVIGREQKRDFDLDWVANKTTFRWDDQRIEFALYASFKQLDHPIFQYIEQVSHDYGMRAKYVHEGDWFGRENRFVAGVDASTGRNRDHRYGNVAGEPGTLLQDNEQAARNATLFLENQHYVHERVAVSLGTQAGWSYRESEDESPHTNANPDDSDTRHYSAINPKVGVRWEVHDSAQLYAAYSRSFEPPSFGEFFAPTGRPNDVRAQTADTIELGTRGEIGRFAWDLTWYHAWVDDELLSLNDAAGNPLGTVNAEDTVHQGIELGIDVDIVRGLIDGDDDAIVLRQAYQWNDFRFDDDDVFDDNELAGIPEHFYRAELRYEHPCGFAIGPNVEWSMQRYAIDHANSFFADPYAVLGVKISYRTETGFSAFAEGRNLLDEEYATTTGVVSDARGRDSRQFLPGDGRGFFVGAEWRW